ncbi:gliding motility-associated peptidyl-prolyl isomerase GldI [Flavobacterium cucumis]|uniref:Peptidyl-prolyl cis-trans isomerase n=1 Tax=Flavobacterium cucumis TaxID=416016 RepID=A0A1M7ZWD8_9FLAO|nr:gliding motility-associated peptidyl-prolyl isomerase GldI [Flavobacterium cucumis]SHO73166.1 protein involved in gliding motility GldI [Flavobacterium cucumis]
MNIKNSILFGLFVLLTSCSQQQQARKPISHSSGTFIKESIERNIKLVASEEKIIDSIIKNDTLKEYLASNKGYWYKYETKVNTISTPPKRGDIAYFDYEVKDILSRIIYTKEDTKPQEYFVDKENIMMGLRDGIKLMKKGETVTFIFPSHMAYGYHGDNKKIGTNEPLICTVTLNDIKIDTPTKNN